MKAKSIASFVILCVLGFAPCGGAPVMPESAALIDRQATIRSYLKALEQIPRVDKMPGTGPTIEQKLLRVLAEEVISLRQENAALKDAIQQSKKKG